MKNPPFMAAGLLVLICTALRAASDPQWLGHDRERPAPAVVTPGMVSTQEQPGTAPSDATVLFEGKDVSAWVAMDGSATKWIVHDGALECVPGSGYVRTLQSFGDCQLHVEWAAPTPPKGDSQGRGNSGIFFGNGRYEVQVLDSYNNKTYADGSAASIYGQYPPLVNASRPPGEWQAYDIVWTAPRFEADGKLAARARVTVLHNGVLVQNNVEVEGPTDWIAHAPYTAHPARLPIAFQDHGNPVRYRNVWVRELGNPRQKEFLLSDALLESYTGDYIRTVGAGMKVRRLTDGLLGFTISGTEVVLHAASPTRFYALTTDVQCEFDFSGDKRKLAVTVGDDFTHAMRLEKKAP